MVKLSVKEERKGLGRGRRNPRNMNIDVRAGQVPGLGKTDDTKSQSQEPTILNLM